MLEFETDNRCQTCPNRVICHCLQVLESQVVETLITLNIRSVKDLRRATGAGDGCTCCHPHLKELVDRFKGSIGQRCGVMDEAHDGSRQLSAT